MAGDSVKQEWVDQVPPRRSGPGKDGSIDHRAIADEAKRHPGKWTRVRNFPKADQSAAFAYKVRTGRWATYGPGFEAVSRTDSKGHGVWIRYVGEEESGE